MLGIALRNVFRASLVSAFLFLLFGIAFLVAALDFPFIETGRRILEENVPLSETQAVNGTVSVQFQAVEEGHYEVYAHPAHASNWFEVIRTYVSISPGGPPINESYALRIHFSEWSGSIYGLRPGTYYVVVDYNLTGGNLEYSLYLCVYHSYRIPDPYHNVAYAFFALSLTSVVISGASWFVLKRRTPDFTTGLRIGLVISFLCSLLAFLSTALPWYAYINYESPEYPYIVEAYSLQNLIDFGLNICSVGRGWFIQLAWWLIVIGGTLALSSSTIGSFEKKEASRVTHGLLASSLLILLSPITISLGFLYYGVPLYGIAGVYPYRYVGFLYYGFFAAVIAGILMMTTSILTLQKKK